ncbi:MAG: TrmH family RNA methyltransferase [Candidatus Dojkabacteria bacterium]
MGIFQPKLKRYNKKFDYSYSFGAYPTLDLLKNRRDFVSKVLIKEEGRNSDGVGEVVRLCEEVGIPLEVNDRLIEKIAFKENTYVVGVFNKYECELAGKSNHLVLVNPSNTGNLGTIIRTMLGFEFKDLAIIRPGVDIFEPKVVRSSMGSLFRINFKYFNSIQEYMERYSGRNIYPFMLDGAKDISEVEFKEPFSFIQGNEGSGLPDEFKSLGQSIFIPHSKDIDSLNLSVATSIGMWEFSRRKEK